jgi:hypothetical protein
LKWVSEAHFKENAMSKDNGKARVRQARRRATAARQARRDKGHLRRNQAGEVPLVEGLLDFLTVIVFWGVLGLARCALCLHAHCFRRLLLALGWYARCFGYCRNLAFCPFLSFS